MWSNALSFDNEEIRGRLSRVRFGIAVGFACLGAVFGPGLELAAQETSGTLQWLSGCWRAGSETAWTEEVWSSDVGGVMLGFSRSVREGRVGGTEFLKLQRTEQGWVYEASPSGQATHAFPSVAASDQQLDVRDPDHDFPQRIHYQRRAADHVIAAVYGAVEDEAPTFELDYRRIPCEP